MAVGSGILVCDPLKLGKVLPELGRTNAFQKPFRSVVYSRLANLSRGCRMADDSLRNAVEQTVVYLRRKQRLQNEKHDCADDAETEILSRNASFQCDHWPPFWNPVSLHQENLGCLGKPWWWPVQARFWLEW